MTPDFTGTALAQPFGPEIHTGYIYARPAATPAPLNPANTTEGGQR